MEKREVFQMRISADMKQQLETLKEFYQISAASVVRMLISREIKRIEEIQGGRK